MTEKAPIFVTGVERSGSSIVARILCICGAFTGEVNNMHENIKMKGMLQEFIQENPNDELIPVTDTLFIPVNWKKKVQSILESDGYSEGVWMYKDSKLTQTWPIWNYAYPNARWIIVRRRTGDVIQSCVKTGFMRMFKEEENRERVNVSTEEEGWLWWVHQYEKRFVEMIESGVNCKQVWPERMVTGDYHQMYETLEWVGLQWNSKILETIDPMLVKGRRK